MTIAVDLGRKVTKPTNQQPANIKFFLLLYGLVTFHMFNYA